MTRLNYAMNDEARAHIDRARQGDEAAAKVAVDAILSEASELERGIFDARMAELAKADYEPPYTERLQIIEQRLRGEYALTPEEIASFRFEYPSRGPFKTALFKSAPSSIVAGTLQACGMTIVYLASPLRTPYKPTYTVWDIRPGRTRAELLYDIDALTARIRAQWKDVEIDDVRDEMLCWLDDVMLGANDELSDDELLNRLRLIYDCEVDKCCKLIRARMDRSNIDPDGMVHWDADDTWREGWANMYAIMSRMQWRRSRRLNQGIPDTDKVLMLEACTLVHDNGPSFATWRGWVESTLDDYRNGGERGWE